MLITCRLIKVSDPLRGRRRECERDLQKRGSTNVVMLSCSDDAKGRYDAVLDVVTVRSLLKMRHPVRSGAKEPRRRLDDSSDQRDGLAMKQIGPDSESSMAGSKMMAVTRRQQ